MTAVKIGDGKKPYVEGSRQTVSRGDRYRESRLRARETPRRVLHRLKRFYIFRILKSFREDFHPRVL